MSWFLTLGCPVPWCNESAKPERGGQKAQVTVKYRCMAGHRFSIDRKTIDQLTKMDQERRVLAAVAAALKSPETGSYQSRPG